MVIIKTVCKQVALFSSIFLFTHIAGYAQNLLVAGMQCEHLADPLGIDNPRPEAPGAIQQFYSIAVETDFRELRIRS
ncbi:hypothetical protein A8C56_13370 [Niabella ginsenosidivorans]|uniref:Uncharacterized protein n=1 Tax=Niabella ginsenosidivorans TaxID=1176587 RepID=A0A1A9I3D2_9BACT|nr:hypothetical protein [Niabella ginsenosidivorans]ANH81835.1 hypothetical protein A8C56_13370 [Niabella ginsenosidivorans]